MIISVSEVKELIDFKDWADAKIERKLRAIEMTIRGYTNNNFQDIDYRRTADIVGGSAYVEALAPFDVGDTVQISETKLNKGLFVITEVDDVYFKTDKALKDENEVLVTKVHYPDDVIDCAINMIEWELEGKEKSLKGIQSETLSRHSVTYAQQNDSNTESGYPTSIMSALEPYMKARF